MDGMHSDDVKRTDLPTRQCDRRMTRQHVALNRTQVLDCRGLSPSLAGSSSWAIAVLGVSFISEEHSIVHFEDFVVDSSTGNRRNRHNRFWSQGLIVVRMLAVFHPTVASPPEEISVPENELSGQTDSAGIVNAYKKLHPSAITVGFGKRCAMAYSHDQEELLRPRYLAVVDEIFCMFVGSLENLTMLKQQYGVTKAVTEVTLIIEIYRALRDRSPYPADHVMRGLSGAFSFVLFDNTTQSIFVGVDAVGKVPFFWGTGVDGALAFSDDPAILKGTTGKTFSPFPQGCFFSSSEGLQSYEHPLQPVTAVPRIDSQGQVCGTTFKVDAKKETLRANSFPRVGSESWGK